MSVTKRSTNIGLVQIKLTLSEQGGRLAGEQKGSDPFYWEYADFAVTLAFAQKRGLTRMAVP